MKDGQTFTRVATGPEHGLQGRDEIKAKFMTQVEFSKTVTPGNAEQILKLLDNLEEVDKVSEIIELTCAK